MKLTVPELSLIVLIGSSGCGKATVVYGHTPQAEILKTNNTINIDTGCVFGGKLTAY